MGGRNRTPAPARRGFPAGIRDSMTLTEVNTDNLSPNFPAGKDTDGEKTWNPATSLNFSDEQLRALTPPFRGIPAADNGGLQIDLESVRQVGDVNRLLYRH